jgi:Cof subfamily protein (haloacid dehalogenase superfamily)
VNADIRLIAVDLDGTLLVNSETIPPRNLEALRRAISQGVTVAIATGRVHQSAVQFVEQLGVENSPVISYNGAMVRLPHASEPLLHYTLDPSTASSIVQYCVSEGHHLNYYIDDEIYCTHIDHWVRLYIKRTNDVFHPVGDLRQFAGMSPTKVLLTAYPHEVDRLLPDLQDLFSKQAYVTRSMPEYIEFLNPQASKGAALAWLADHLGLRQDQVMACGDMLNDLPMIEWAGIGVAMPSAEEGVRAAADFVPGHETEGVAEAIEKYLG